METTSENMSKESEESPQLNDNIEEKASPQLQDVSKKTKKDDRNRRDDRNVEQFMKSLNSIPRIEEKLSQVCKKYVQTSDENKKLHFYIKQSDKRHALLLKEKEQLQLEFNKCILVKSKLENLCRELQKQNKAIKEESLLKIREEEERRKETQAKFQSTLSEITALLQQNNEKNAKLRDDNVSMSEKFKSVVQQYQLREQQVDKMAKQMALESQLSDAKLQKAGLEHQAEKEHLLVEMEQTKMEVAQCRAKILEMSATETSLRSQIAVYTDKYDEFQNALLKSNQVFGGFKGEMEKMSKKIQKLEKESSSWKKRWETSQAALIDSCGDKQAADQRTAHAQRQLDHMQRLCRTLQAERTVLLSTLKEHNIERPPLPAPAPAPPAPAPESNNKVDAMAANCAHLRQSLAHIQNQLNVLTNQKQTDEQPANPEQPAKPEKSKKSKSKKNKDKHQHDAKDATEEAKPGTTEQIPAETINIEDDLTDRQKLNRDSKSNSEDKSDIEEKIVACQEDTKNGTENKIIATPNNAKDEIINCQGESDIENIIKASKSNAKETNMKCQEDAENDAINASQESAIKVTENLINANQDSAIKVAVNLINASQVHAENIIKASQEVAEDTGKVFNTSQEDAKNNAENAMITLVDSTKDTKVKNISHQEGAKNVTEDNAVEILIEAINQAKVSLDDLDIDVENRTEEKTDDHIEKNNVSLVEMNPNEEIGHIVEVKPILEGKSDVSC